MISTNLESTEQDRLAKRQAPSRRPELNRIIDEIDHLCRPLVIGDRLPTHTDLMRQLNASERTVLRALDELQRQGRIVRRHGSGTFIARLAAPYKANDIAAPVKAIVAIASPDHSFFDHAIELLYSHARDAELNLVCCLMSNENDQESVISSIAPAEGYVVFNHRYAPVAKQLLERGNRIVVIGSPQSGTPIDVPNVYGDQERGGFLAADHLIEIGHRRLYFWSPDDNFSKTLRWSGIQIAIARARKSGLEITLETNREVNQAELVNSPEKLRKYFSGKQSPTAVLAWNDYEAGKLITLLGNCGLKVPHDISVIGYDALPETPGMLPRLTTVDGRIHEQLSAAVRILTRETPPPMNYTVVAIPALIIKDSTAPPTR